MDALKKIHPKDSVYVVHQALQAGDKVYVDGHTIVIEQDLTFGHKVASTYHQVGDAIIKFGVPIGQASTEIRVGDHVHIHNLKSNYLKTFTRDDAFKKS
jgi:hypothetical protein